MKTALVSLESFEVQSGEDLQLAAYLLNPAKHSYELDEVVWEYLHERIPAPNDIAGGKGKTYPLALVPLDKMTAYAGQRADAIFDAGRGHDEQLKKIDAIELYHKVEMPLLYVLAEMEKKGVLVDTALLKQMSVELGQLLSLSEEKIHRLAGEKFNINSPKQLQNILFEKLKLPAGKKTKEGYSTDVDVLTDLARSHELPAEILAYRSSGQTKIHLCGCSARFDQSANRPDSYILQPDGNGNRQALQQQSQSAEYSHPYPGRQKNPSGFYRRSGLFFDFRRLFANRASGAGASVRR